MHRTTIMLPEHVHAKVRRLAADRRVSMATLIREAIEDKVSDQQPKPTCLGMADSGYTDTGRLAGEVWPEPYPWR